MQALLNKKSWFDCGLFALAFSMMLASDVDPEGQILDSTRLRNHFRECLQSKEASLFPAKAKRIPKGAVFKALFLAE